MQPYEAVIGDCLSSLVPVGKPVALFDFPTYTNVGDSAIWLGTIDYLSRHRTTSRILWVGDGSVHDHALPSLPEDCTILINGGGNFGDIWPSHQVMRERLLLAYPHNRIIQLPQSVFFGCQATAEDSRLIFSQHRDFHLLLRDEESFAICKSLYECNVVMCPDMALHLSQLPRSKEPDYDVFALLRTDKERTVGFSAPEGFDWSFAKADWVEQQAGPFQLTYGIFGEFFSRYPSTARFFTAFRRRLFTSLARERLLVGFGLLSRGRVVVTDRLHGHILCTLMGIPHVVLDNNYGKINRFRKLWNTGTDICHAVPSLSDAYERVDLLLMSPRSTSVISP
ncbi:polysaccharide pyruvyl transferase family protein [Pseudohaliea sp.]|uniref:polysaccharide pyruvyl transferase family protein n=1 Tax=Pseudohaliea sp. TaxID=2740289 RepID=UPI0032EF635F